MARQIEDIIVRLGFQDDGNLARIRSSFRELGKVTELTDKQLLSARRRLFELKEEFGNTERANRGLIDAFNGLLSETKRGSSVWQQLNSDLAKLRQESRLTDTQISSLREIIVKESQAHAQSATSIREHVKSLQDLRNQASLNGKVHQQLGADIQRLTATLEQGTETNKKHNSSLGQILAVKPDAVLKQWQAYSRILQEGAVSADQLATAQRRLNQLSGAPRILERRRVIESAAITQDPEYLKRFGFEGRSLPELPNTNAAYAQQIKELQQDLAHLDRTSNTYLQTLVHLAGVQRQSTEVARGYAQALLTDLQTGKAATSTRNLQEVITALRAEMQQLDTTTSEGSATYAANANQVRILEKQLRDLGEAYSFVGTRATQAATAEQNAANARISNNYLNRGMVVQQEAALAELGQRVRQGVSGTPLLLPAAGQTSAPGTGLSVSGGAVPGRRQVLSPEGRVAQLGMPPGSGVERFFGVNEPGLVAATRPTGPAMTPRQAEADRPRIIAESDARRANAEAMEAQRQRMEGLRAAVDKASQANTGSIKSLGGLRAALNDIREELSPTSTDFKQYTTRLEQVDTQLGKIEARRGRRLSGMQFAQAAGAAITGGIYGGPEGFLGGVIGGVAGRGVGGAFAGAAIGAQVGMFRQQLGGAATYAADIGKLQIALRGIVGSQDAYNRALAAAASVTKDLNVPQETAIQGLTRLSAAVLGAGGNVNDSAFAFRAMSEAIKATGGGAEQVDGALLALTQVFSKGKVSAEELNQIAERLPGTFTLFAKATGRTGPELTKALEQGKVGLNDLMKFLESLGGRYGETALKIAASTEDAGARLSVAMKAMQLEVGKALQPVGAQLQSAFANFITGITPAAVLAANAISAAIGAMYKGISAGFNLLISMRGLLVNLTKVMLVFGGATAGVFVATNIGTFVNALKGVLLAMRAILSVEKALLFVENARVAAQALLVGLTSGAGKGKIAGLVLGAGAGVAAAVGLGKLTEQVTASIEKGLSGALKGVDTKLPQLPTFATPPTDDKEKAAKAAKTAADKARALAEQNAAQDQRLANDLMEAQLRAADTVFQHQIELDRQRYELQKSLDDQQSQNRILRETGAARDITSKFEALKRDLREIGERRMTAYQAVQMAMQQRNTAAQRAAFAAAGATNLGAGRQDGLPSGISGYITGAPRSPYYRADHGGQNYHEHLQFVSRAAAEAAYKTLTKAGVKVTEFQGYGRVGGHTPGSAHYSGTAFDVPAAQVPVGKEQGLTALVQQLLGISTRRPTGVVTQTSRAIRTGATATQEQLELDKATEAYREQERTAAKQVRDRYTQFSLELTDTLRQQNQELTDNNELQRLRNRLSTEGFSPERIALEERLAEVERDRNRANQVFLEYAKDPAVDPAKVQSDMQSYNDILDQNIRKLNEAYEAQQAYNNSVGGGFRDGASAYVQSIGTMREATSQLAQTGIKGVEDAIFSLVTTGTANFREFAASILRDTARMIIQQLILRSVMQIIGAIGGGGGGSTPGLDAVARGNAGAAAYMPNALGAAYAANGIQPFAMGGVVRRPTLFAYANGGVPGMGLMGEAGPEAVLPLRRLPSGRLGVESTGGGSTNVTVNVDASGSQVQGDSGRGEALGRAVSAAVQQELIKQKRPGGLLS